MFGIQQKVRKQVQNNLNLRQIGNRRILLMKPKGFEGFKDFETVRETNVIKLTETFEGNSLTLSINVDTA